MADETNIKDSEPAIQQLQSLLASDSRDSKQLNAIAFPGGTELLAGFLINSGIRLTFVDSREQTQTKLSEHFGKAKFSFLPANISSCRFASQLSGANGFDIAVAANILDTEYDLGRMLSNVRSILAKDSYFFCKVRNGYATRNVLSDPVMKKVGIALLPPDSVGLFGRSSARFYYRSWDHIRALAAFSGFSIKENIPAGADASTEQTIRHLKDDIKKIKHELAPGNFQGATQFKPVRLACKDYIDQLESDMLTMPGDQLYHHYRARHWEFVLFAS